MGGLDRRVVVGELMDRPDVDPRELAQALRYLRSVNRVFGGVPGLTRHLAEWSRAWRPGATITLLDVGTGSADIPVAVREWGRRRGFDIRVTGLDFHDATLAEAQRFVGERDGISLVRGDALRLEEHVAPASFDFAHAGLFLHHLNDDDVVRVLAGMWRVCRRGLVWNDLVRSRGNLALVSMFLVGQSRMVRHDGRVSVRAAFTRDEAVELARRAGIADPRVRRGPLFYRFTLAAEKANAPEARA